MSLSPDQKSQRLDGITATDVAAICGLHPHKSAIDVWLEKTGQSPPSPDTERSKWGDILEPVVRRDYEERHDVRVDVPGTLTDLEHAWMMATPDGLVHQRGAADPDRGLEIKTHTFRIAHLYGDPGSDQIPLWELVQCMWGMAVTDLERWDLCAFIDNQPTDYIIDRDDEAIGTLIEKAERFYVDCVQGGEPPAPDGSESYDRWLLKRWPNNPANLVDIGEDDETFTLVDRARELRAAAADLEREHQEIRQKLMLKIGDAEGLTWKDAKGRAQKVTWKRSKPTRRTDSAGAFTDVKNSAALFVSANAGRIERALISLKSAGEHTVIGTSSQATITAGELADMLSEMSQTMRRIAAHQATVVELPGNRPFCFPRSWKAPASAKED